MILKHVIVLTNDSPAEDGQIIPRNATGFAISQEYLSQSSFSLDDHKSLLAKAKQAKTQGCRYIYFQDYGKFGSIPNAHLID
jgi:hypothetical protein